MITELSSPCTAGGKYYNLPGSNSLVWGCLPLSAKPLDGIRVLSFEIQVAGPYCTMMLADQGANVIKVERPEGGDTARGGAPKIKNDKGETQSGYFLRFNRNKRSVTLNLKSDRGRQIFRELAKKSDVVV